MTKWEYKTITRARRWEDDPMYPRATWKIGTDWDIDIDKTLRELGEQGWELVAITPRSSYLGGFREGSLLSNSSADYAGFTSSETWVFKRLQSW